VSSRPVLPDGVDDVGDVEARAKHGRSAARGAVTEIDQRVLVHPQAFLDVALGQSGLRLTRLARAAPQMLQRARKHPEGERLLGGSGIHHDHRPLVIAYTV
jgi:hypothetical protein